MRLKIQVPKKVVILLVLCLTIIGLVAADPVRDYLHGSNQVSNAGFSNGFFQTNLFTGSAYYAYPLEVPPGTNGLAPRLSIFYNSLNAKQAPGPFGKGWSISQAYVQRNTEFTPADASDDTFDLIFGGNSYNLVYNGGQYHTEIESFMYIEKKTGGNNQKKEYWMVRTKEGTQYRFGYNQDSELVSNQHGHVIRWSLDLVTDTHTNKIYYSYQEDPTSNDVGAIYPYKIQYNNEQSREVRFLLTNTDSSRIWTTYSNGQKSAYARRISGIEMRTGGSLVRRYDLSYSDISLGNDAMSSITYIGSDGLSSLPPTQFEYFYDAGWNQNNAYNPPSNFINREEVGNSYVYFDSGTRIADTNKDGKSDYLNDDYCPEDFTTTVSIGSGGYMYGADNGMRLADVNGDGWLDCLMGNSYEDEQKTWVGPPQYGWLWPNPSSSWQPPVYFSEVVCYNCDPSDYGDEEFHSRDTGIRIADVNGDGRADLLKGNSGVYMSTGSGWQQGSTYEVPAAFVVKYRDSKGQWKYGDNGLRVADLNGDGLVDLVQTNATTAADKVWFNDGVKWVQSTSWNVPIQFTNSDREDIGVRVVDVNGDLRADLLTNNDAYINNGAGWLLEANWAPPTPFVDDHNDNEGVRLGDINGDGDTDIIKAHVSEGKSTWISKSGENYLLKKVTNSLGGHMSIDYQPSSQLSNSPLGFNMWVVSSTTADNGIQGYAALTAATHFSYVDGKYDTQTKEFQGFGIVTETNANGTQIEHKYHQNPGNKGLEYETTIKDKKESVLTKTIQDWQTTDNGGYYVTALIKHETQTLDGPTPKKIADSYSYDSYGNVISVVHSGDLDVAGDEKNEAVEYVYNTNAWIMDKPKHRSVFKVGIIREAWFRYDGYGYGQPASKGDLTYEETWLDTGSNPVERFTYDSYGNLITSTNARGYSTAYGFDSTHTLLTSVTNAKEYTTQFDYDLGSGNLISRTDPNGNAVQYTYDAFGRKTAEILPYDSMSYPTVNIVYNGDGIAPESIKVMQKEAGTSTLDSYSFFDGLGNLIQTKQESETSQWITQDTRYNEMGQIAEQSNPYISVSSANSDPADTAGIRYAYDALNRLAVVRNQDGTKRKNEYEGWQSSSYDENGHRTDYGKDAYGSVVFIKEHSGNQVFQTTYEYDGQGNLMKVTDSKGNAVSYQYDSLGRKVQLDDPDLGVWQYVYDADSNLISQTDAQGSTITLQYDELDRVTKKSTTDTTSNYYYDTEKKGTVYKVQNDDVETTYQYDNRLRVTSEQKKIQGTVFSFTYAYDSMDRVTTKTLPDGSKISYVYNAQGNIESIGGIVDNVDYNAHGSKSRKTYHNGLTTSLEYDDRLQLESTTTPDKQKLAYEYDDVGNIIQIQDGTNNKISTFQYDDLNRLVHATSDFDNAYTFDRIGNVLSIESSLGNIDFTYQAHPVHSPSSVSYEDVCADNDEDGYPLISCGGTDCNDNNANINPGKLEVCDGLDNDCDGGVDEGFVQDSCPQKCSYTWTGNGGSLNCCGDDTDEGNPYQSPESSCGDDHDNDCDGHLDSTDSDCFICVPSQKKNCPNQIGVCNGAQETCTVSGQWPGCDYSAVPYYEVNEATCDGKDNDCDGGVDENSICAQCGDGIVQTGEECDPPGVRNSCNQFGQWYLQDYCSSSCTWQDNTCEDDYPRCTSDPACDENMPGTGECSALCEYSACIPQWSCSAWSVCISQQRTRLCADLNSCGTAEGKPIESESCTDVNVQFRTSDLQYHGGSAIAFAASCRSPLEAYGAIWSFDPSQMAGNCSNHGIMLLAVPGKIGSYTGVKLYQSTIGYIDACVQITSGSKAYMRYSNTDPDKVKVDTSPYTINSSNEVSCDEPHNLLRLSKGWNLVSPVMGPATKQDVRLYLDEGWNLVGYSGKYPFFWLNATAGGTSIELAQAAGLIQASIYYYDNGYRLVPGDDGYLQPNKAYWIYATQNGLILNFQNVTAPDTESNILWDDLRVYDGYSYTPLSDAAEQGIIQHYAYYFNETTQTYGLVPGNSDSVQAWRGYWVYANEDSLSLVLP